MAKDWFEPWGGVDAAMNRLPPSVRVVFRELRSSHWKKRQAAVQRLPDVFRTQHNGNPREALDIITRQLYEMCKHDRSKQVRKVIGEVIEEWTHEIVAVNALLNGE